jgi:hypothetical protein
MGGRDAESCFSSSLLLFYQIKRPKEEMRSHAIVRALLVLLVVALLQTAWAAEKAARLFLL